MIYNRQISGRYLRYLINVTIITPFRSVAIQLSETAHNGVGPAGSRPGRSAGLYPAGGLQQRGAVYRQFAQTFPRRLDLCEWPGNWIDHPASAQSFFRFRQTYIGQVLVSVNPYKELNVYSEQNINEYRGRHFFQAPPHMWVWTLHVDAIRYYRYGIFFFV